MSWHLTRLGDVVTLKRGHDLPDSKREPGEVPVVSSSGVTGLHNVAMVKGPGVVTGRYGTLGEVFYIDEDYWPLNTSLYVVDFKGNHPRFVAYFLKNVLKNYQSDKAAVPGVDRNVLHELKVQITDPPTQERIATVLCSYDELINNNLRRMKLLDETARQLYQEWFVRLRFSGHEHTPIENGVPKGWERLPFEEALTLQRGFDLPIQDREEGEVPVYGSTGITGFHSKARVAGPGVVTGRSGTLGEVHYTPGDFWPLNTALWVKEFKRVGPFYALFLMREMDLKQYNGGASVPTLDRKAVHRVEILVPPRSILSLFDDFASPVFQQIQILTAQIRKLRTARELLLPRLVTGEIIV
jgi:type I restriction enzyme S subunit